MKAQTMINRLVIVGLLAVFAVSATCASAQGDRRKETTIQTATADSVTIKYLNLPWGETTFGYMEDGGSQYYSTRDWPFAHVKLTKKAKWIGTTLEPGDYVWVITPKSDVKPMALSIWKFTPGASGTFLVAGDVFTERPKDAVMVASKPIKFERGMPLVDHLEISAAAKGKKADVMVHYGTRGITEEISVD